MPTRDQIESAIEAMKKLTANYEYFFEHNASPDWITPLRAEGFFQHPPAPIRYDDRSLAFPPWAESRYLARMADLAPDLVAEVLLALPSTDNISVHDDVVQAALKLAGRLARQLSSSERKWIRGQKQLFWMLPDRLADLVAHLAKQGEADEAFLLAAALLEVREDPRWAAATDDDKRYLAREPVGLTQPWEYQRAVAKILPALAEADSIRALELFGRLLQTAIELSEPTVKGDQRDHSFVWRPAIESHGQNRPSHAVRDILVDTVRDAALSACQKDEANLERVVGMLEGRQRSVFRRLALYVLTHFGYIAPRLAVDRLSDWTIYSDPALRHEYSGLAQVHFRDVPGQQAEELLDHLRTPPAMDNYRRNFESIHGRSPTEEEIEQTVQGIELKQLAVLADFLPDSWRERYSHLVDSLGKPEHPDFMAYSSGVWTGPTSPKTAEELLAMTVEELLTVLQEWRPTGEPFGTSPDGLGRQLTAAIAMQPERFAEQAARFSALEPTYARAVIDGFDQAIRNEKTFPWPAILELTGYVVAQPDAPSAEDEDDWDRDPNWRWARNSAAHLLTDGLRRMDGGIPIELRSQVWAVIRPLTDDPEPTPEYEERYGGSNMDPLTLSINTTRGNAMHATVSYALWVRRDDEKKHPERVEAGLQAMPEVQEVLDGHLDPGRDPSMAVRAVYGERLPWLVLLDTKWVTAVIPLLFPADGELQQLRDAVWDTYLVNAPYDNVFEILVAEYHRAVAELDVSEGDEAGRRIVDPAARLGEHLMTLYWRGRLTWANEGALLEAFFDKAPEPVRAHALDFVGRSLWQGDFELPDDQAERLRDLWERRFAAFMRNKPAHRKEVAAYGWWFASSGKLPDDWLLSQLLALVEAGATTEADHLVVERLADVAGACPLEAVRATRLMVEATKEPYFAMASEEALRRLVNVALAADNEDVRGEVGRLLNELAARGFNALNDLAAEL